MFKCCVSEGGERLFEGWGEQILRPSVIPFIYNANELTYAGLGQRQVVCQTNSASTGRPKTRESIKVELHTLHFLFIILQRVCI